MLLLAREHGRELGSPGYNQTAIVAAITDRCLTSGCTDKEVFSKQERACKSDACCHLSFSPWPMPAWREHAPQLTAALPLSGTTARTPQPHKTSVCVLAMQVRYQHLTNPLWSSLSRSHSKSMDTCCCHRRLHCPRKHAPSSLLGRFVNVLDYMHIQ